MTSHEIYASGEKSMPETRGRDVAEPRYSEVMAARKLAPGNQVGRLPAAMSTLERVVHEEV